MKRITAIKKLLICSILLALFMVLYHGVSNVSHASKTALSPRDENKELNIRELTIEHSDHQILGGDAKNPNDVVPFKTKYDVKDIYEMITAANLIDDDNRRVQTLKRIALLWTVIDPDACLKWALSIADDKVGYEYITAQVILTLIGYDQFEKAIQLVQEIPQGSLRDTAIGYSMYDLANLDLGTAARLLDMIASIDQIERSTGTLSKVLIESHKLSELKEMYENLSYGAVKESLGSAAIRVLMLQDPLKAVDWLRDNPELKNAKNFEALAFGFAKNDPVRGIEIANEINDPVMKQEYLSWLINGWAENSPSEAGEWITEQIEVNNFNQNREQFSMIALKALARNQSFLFNQIAGISNRNEREVATLSAASALSSYNPQKAAEIALATPSDNPANQVEALTITAKNWLSRDPLEASKWIGNLPNGQIRDSAVSELVNNILTKDRDIAMANSWAAQIRNPEMKAKVLSDIARFNP